MPGTDPISGDLPPGSEAPTLADIAKAVKKPPDADTETVVEALVAESLQTRLEQVLVDQGQALLEAEKERFEEDTNLRKHYANKLLSIALRWIWFLVAAIGAEAVAKLFGKELLSDAVLLGVTGGTTATVLGMVTIVATSLFPKEARKSILETLIARSSNAQSKEPR